MKYPLDIQVKIAREKILNGSSVLLFGKPEATLEVLKKSYEELSKHNNFLCSFHDASKINSFLDFYTSILKLKFGEDYEARTKYFFEMQVKHPDKISILMLTDYCGQDLQGKTENERKLPIIFVEGFEKLLFKLDFPKGHKKMELGFGNNLRVLHQARRAIFCGTVQNKKSLEYKTTLGDYSYLFYDENFSFQKIE